MYTSHPTPASARVRQAASVYSRIGVQTGVEAASPHRLVAMLYDGLFEALQRARGALQGGNVPEMGRCIAQAVRIADEGLRSTLDLNNGGQLAADLHGLYGYVIIRLTKANLKADDAGIVECMRLLAPVRDAWNEIGPRGNAGRLN